MNSILDLMSGYPQGCLKACCFVNVASNKIYHEFNFSTHLYGRRLVLEWAEEEETVEDLRRKTAHSFVGNSEAYNNGPLAKRAKTKSSIVETLQTL